MRRKIILILLIAILINLCGCTEKNLEPIANTSESNTINTTATINSVTENSTIVTSEINKEINLNDISENIYYIVNDCVNQPLSINLALGDLNDDGIPEFFLGVHSMKINSIYYVYNIQTCELLFKFYAVKPIIENIPEDIFSPIFNECYYIDSETNQKYYIASYLESWGADGFSNVYTKIYLDEDNTYKLDEIGLPLDPDTGFKYDPTERTNLFNENDECKAFNIKNVVINDGVTDEKIEIAIEELIEKYYSTEIN